MIQRQDTTTRHKGKTQGEDTRTNKTEGQDASGKCNAMWTQQITYLTRQNDFINLNNNFLFGTRYILAVAKCHAEMFFAPIWIMLF